MGDLLSQQAEFVGNLYPDITINLNIDTVSTIFGHEDKMKRVIHNLFSNSYNAMQQTGTIELGTKKIDNNTVHC